jgi:hypothetical protein
VLVQNVLNVLWEFSPKGVLTFDPEPHICGSTGENEAFQTQGLFRGMA